MPGRRRSMGVLGDAKPIHDRRSCGGAENLCREPQSLGRHASDTGNPLGAVDRRAKQLVVAGGAIGEKASST